MQRGQKQQTFVFDQWFILSHTHLGVSILDFMVSKQFVAVVCFSYDVVFEIDVPNGCGFYFVCFSISQKVSKTDFT